MKFVALALVSTVAILVGLRVPLLESSSGGTRC